MPDDRGKLNQLHSHAGDFETRLSISAFHGQLVEYTDSLLHLTETSVLIHRLVVDCVTLSNRLPARAKYPRYSFVIILFVSFVNN